MGLFYAAGSEAQDTLYISSHALDTLNRSYYLLDDTSHAGITPPFGIWVYNPTNSPFNNYLFFAYTITSGGNTDVYNSWAFIGSGFRFAPQFITIAPHDSALVYGIRLYVSRPDFEIGASTVVIWPVIHTGSLVSLDSASTVINVDTIPQLGVKSLNEDQPKVFMSGSFLNVVNGSGNTFGRIRISNLDGRMIDERALMSNNKIPMAQYSAGIYFAEILFGDGNRFIFKIFNPGNN